MDKHVYILSKNNIIIVGKAKRLRGKRRLVVLTSDVCDELKKLKYGNEAYDHVIRRLIESYKKRFVLEVY